ncbi:tRNA (guanine26-N2/guanine27-N2)-dimethyltransferase [Pancytospora epiphaga]|nr:tRNA (guanine26-N2/guanine27-N2)-dimethyltransferase [Pancytospora epiphaga]
MVEYIEEGGVKIVKDESTFFNPAQKLNRDLSIETIKAYFENKEKIVILDAMSATGLRGIRYLQDIPNSHVVFNDISASALKAIKDNLKMNGISEYTEVPPYPTVRDCNTRACVSLANCSLLMHQNNGYFDVVDIDPFGSCANFVNDALRAVKHNGLLCFTCTDKAVLCSNEKKCYIRYNTHIKKIYSKNETAVRVLLSYISRECSKYDYSIVPILTLSVDFYVRVIVKVLKSSGKAVLSDNSNAFLCDCLNNKLQPFNLELNPTCSVCGASMRLYGPFWSKPLYDKNTISRMLSRINPEGNDRICSILTLMDQEIDALFYYELPRICSKLKINSCKLRTLMNGLANSGYLVSFVYYDNNAIKTNAPLNIINEVMRDAMLEAPMKYNFESNEIVKQLFDKSYSKGLIMSGMKPLGLPKSI